MESLLKNIPEIPEAKLDASTRSKLNSGGNLNVFVPTSASDFTNPNVANANKVWEVQTAIDTGASNIDFTALDSVIISFKGGSLTGTGTITGNLTDVRGEIPEASYFTDGYTFVGTWKVTDISAQWFGMVDTSTSALYDNRNAIKNALYVANSSGHCNLNFYAGHYYVSLQDYKTLINDNVNFGVFNTTHVNLVGHNFPKIESLQDLVSSDSMMFQFFEAPYCSISGFELVGDAETHATAREKRMGVVIGQRSDFTKVHDNKIHDFKGDGVYFTNDVSDLDWYQVTPYAIGDFDTGAIDETTGVLDAAQTDFMSSNFFHSIGPDAEAFGYIYITGRTDQETGYISFYDVSETFIGKTKLVEFYDRVYIPTGTSKVKLTIKAQATLDVGRPLRFTSIPYAQNVEIKRNDIHNCWRQGISNAPAYTIIEGNLIHDIYGNPAGPCAGVDLEDGERYTAGVKIINNIFYNNSGVDILLQYNRNITVEKNFFMPVSHIEEARFQPYYGSFDGGYAASFSTGTTVINNKFFSKYITIGRNQIFANNYVKNTGITLEKGSCSVHDNFFVNTKIKSGLDDYAFVGVPEFYNNNFIWDANYEINTSGAVFQHLIRFNERNNVFDFKGHSDALTSILQYKGSAVANADSSTGSIDSMILRNLTAKNGGGWNCIDTDLSNSYISCGYYDKNQTTTPRDTYWKNNTIKEFVDLDLRTYTLTAFPGAPSTYKTKYFDGLIIIKEDVAVTTPMFRTSDDYFNLHFTNCTFRSSVNVTAVLSLLNKGSVVFDSCTFDFPSAESYDFATSGVSSSTVINCKTRNFTFSNATSEIGTVVLP